jgi:hypothetical protein
MLLGTDGTPVDSLNRVLPDLLISRGGAALARLAAIDLRYEGLIRGLQKPNTHNGDTRLRQLERRQIRERVSFERQFTATHEAMSDLILRDLTSTATV